jgi:hypothetical protein
LQLVIVPGWRCWTTSKHKKRSQAGVCPLFSTWIDAILRAAEVMMMARHGPMKTLNFYAVAESTRAHSVLLRQILEHSSRWWAQVNAIGTVSMTSRPIFDGARTRSICNRRLSGEAVMYATEKCAGRCARTVHRCLKRHMLH